MTGLSELEGAVLGLLWSDGPLTAYAIRSRFLNSRSSHFSGSSGAIYPLVERIKQAGLVTAEKRSQGKRVSTLYRLNDAGQQALRAWLTPVESWMAAVEFDPIRTRVHFLGTLTPAQRKHFFREAAAHLEAEIQATESLIAQLHDQDDKWKTWGARGALSVLTARQKWVEEIRECEE